MATAIGVGGSNVQRDLGCASTTEIRLTRSLVGYGVLAGPFYVVVALAQALLRPGFNLMHDDVSLLSNGHGGWVQVANFIITGAMVIACSLGIHRVLAASGKRSWSPVLLAIFGAGLIGAGIVVADPMNGFPAGAPAGHPTTISTHGVLHIVSAGIGFMALIAFCFAMARQLRTARHNRFSWASAGTGVLYLVAFVGVASGSSSVLVVAFFWMALIAAWTWLGMLSVRMYGLAES